MHPGHPVLPPGYTPSVILSHKFGNVCHSVWFLVAYTDNVEPSGEPECLLTSRDFAEDLFYHCSGTFTAGEKHFQIMLYLIIPDLGPVSQMFLHVLSVAEHQAHAARQRLRKRSAVATSMWNFSIILKRPF